MTWQNLFASPAPGADFDVWDRAVRPLGRRPLGPRKRFQTTALTFGLAAPLDGRVNVTAAYGILEQDETLLPYSFNPTSRLNVNGDPRSRPEPTRSPSSGG